MGDKSTSVGAVAPIRGYWWLLRPRDVEKKFSKNSLILPFAPSFVMLFSPFFFQRASPQTSLSPLLSTCGTPKPAFPALPTLTCSEQVKQSRGEKYLYYNTPLPSCNNVDEFVHSFVSMHMTGSLC